MPRMRWIARRQAAGRIDATESTWGDFTILATRTDWLLYCILQWQALPNKCGNTPTTPT